MDNAIHRMTEPIRSPHASSTSASRIRIPRGEGGIDAALQEILAQTGIDAPRNGCGKDNPIASRILLGLRVKDRAAFHKLQAESLDDSERVFGNSCSPDIVGEIQATRELLQWIDLTLNGKPTPAAWVLALERSICQSIALSAEMLIHMERAIFDDTSPPTPEETGLRNMLLTATNDRNVRLATEILQQKSETVQSFLAAADKGINGETREKISAFTAARQRLMDIVSTADAVLQMTQEKTAAASMVG